MIKKRPYTEEDRPWCQVWRLPVAEDVLVKFSSNIPDWLDSDDDRIFEPYDPDKKSYSATLNYSLGRVPLCFY